MNSGIIGLLVLICVSAHAGDVRRGSFWQQLNANQKAAAQAKKEIQTISGNPPSPTNQAALAAAQQKLQDNLNGIAQKGRSRPNDYQAQLAVGQALVGLDDHARARPFIDRTIELGRDGGDPRQEAAGHALLAQSYLQQKKFDEAAGEARRALGLDGRNKTALFVLHDAGGRSASEGGGGTEGSSAAGAAGPGAAPRAAMLVNSGGSAGGGVEGLTATADQRKAAQLLDEAASKLAMDPTAAKPLVEKALALDPSSARGYFLRAGIKSAARDLAGAAADLDRALALQPQYPEARAARADLGVALGRAKTEIAADYLASGRAPAGFDDYYREAVARLGAAATSGAARTDGAAPGGPAQDLGTSGGRPRRLRDHGPALALAGLGLVVFGGLGALLLKRFKRDYPETRG